MVLQGFRLRPDRRPEVPSGSLPFYVRDFDANI